jgi:hypothetical protein
MWRAVPGSAGVKEIKRRRKNLIAFILFICGKRFWLRLEAALRNVSPQTIYNWLNDFLAYRWDNLEYQKAPGHPPRLTKSQKRNLAK